jgi:hypothetical protein
LTSALDGANSYSFCNITEIRKDLSIKKQPRKLNGRAVGYGLDDRRFESRYVLVIFLFTTVFKPVLGPIQLPIKWVPGTLSLGISGRGVKLTTHI